MFWASVTVVPSGKLSTWSCCVSILVFQKIKEIFHEKFNCNFFIVFSKCCEGRAGCKLMNKGLTVQFPTPIVLLSVVPVKLSSAGFPGLLSQHLLLVDSLLWIYISRIWATAGVTSSQLPYQIRRRRAYRDSCRRAAVRREWSFNCLPPHMCLLLWCCICSASYR